MATAYESLERQTEDIEAKLAVFVESKKKSLETAKERAEKIQNETKENVAKLRQKLTMAEKTGSHSKKVLSERTAELASARNEMEEVSQMHKQLASEAKELDLNLSRLTLKKQELEEAAEGRKGSHAAQRSEIELAVNTYEQRLGLKFEREKDDALRFTFTNIDSADPAKKFTFTVFVNPSKIYEVLLCEPMIPEIDNMVANLNENPKMFGEFVRSMRQAFKDL